MHSHTQHTRPTIHQHGTSHHMAPHYTTLHRITLHHIASQHMTPQHKLAILLCPLDCVCVFCVCVVCVMFRFVVCIVRVLVLWSVSPVWSLLSVVLCRVIISLVVLCVIRFLVHTSAWNDKRGLVAHLVVWGVFRFFDVVIVCSVRVCCVHW